MKSIQGAVLAMLVLTFTAANGSTCRPPSACEQYSWATSVFVGRVIASEKVADGSVRMRFAVSKAFKGVSETEVLVVSKPSVLFYGAVANLRPGEEYLVFAKADADHQLIIGECGSVFPSRFAAGDIRVLEEQKGEHAHTTLVYGSLLHRRGQEDLVSIPEATIEARGSAGSFQTLSQADGSFQIRNIAPGTYKVRADLEDTLAADEQEVDVEAGACKAVRLMAVWNGRVSGRVLRANGEALAKELPTELTLLSLEKGDEESLLEPTDDEGNYAFEHVQPGRYTLKLFDLPNISQDYPFPPLFYPGVENPELATVFEVGEGQKFDNADFIVQDFEPQKLRIQVRWPDHRPASGAHVFVEYKHSYCWKKGCLLSYWPSDKNGRVLLDAYGSGVVRVYATAKPQTGAEWITQFKELDLSKLPLTTILTIAKPNDYNQQK
jgi:hypothetical protein